MNAAAILLLESLGRTTLWLATAGVLAGVLLRLVRSEWPTAHRVAWLLVLVIGWTFLRLPVAVPWYDAELGEPSDVEVAAVETTLAAPPVIDLAPAAAEPILPSPVVDLAAADSLPARGRFNRPGCSGCFAGRGKRCQAGRWREITLAPRQRRRGGRFTSPSIGRGSW